MIFRAWWNVGCLWALPLVIVGTDQGIQLTYPPGSGIFRTEMEMSRLSFHLADKDEFLLQPYKGDTFQHVSL